MATGQKIWDPLRRREVALTPEEQVRQWLIGVLRDGAQVPVHQMMSEVELRSGRKSWRADLVVYGRGGTTLAIAECKRPSVALTPEVLEQALRYNSVLDVRCIIISNGRETRVFTRRLGTTDQVGGDGTILMAGSDRPSPSYVWSAADHLLSYDEMLTL